MELSADSRRMEAGARPRGRLHCGAEDRRAVPLLSMQRVAELGVMAGLPHGVFNVSQRRDGPVVGRHLGEHPDVDVLTFTGFHRCVVDTSCGMRQTAT